MSFEKVLIANRGEIACRITRALHELDIEALAVYSEADEGAPHVEQADDAALLGGPRAVESYLDMDRVLEVASEHGADAVHPGYGFLAENAAFARRVVDAGLTWIGPRPEAMELLGRKTDALELARSIDVPVVPGSIRPLTDAEDAAEWAERIGYPVLLKAAGGGGGIGMNFVEDPDRLEQVFASTAKRVAAYFGDGALFLEKALENPRHIEVQVLGDRHGSVRHLLERECSIQRRNQKIFEEGPTPADLDPSTIEELHRSACAIARESGYDSAGTAEFLVDRDGGIHFIEMNARLQVEHPVSELITGRDIVQEMIRVAAGEPVSFEQKEIEANGAAIEARIYAEDPDRGYRPSPGVLEAFSVPDGEGIRQEVGVREGTKVTPYYDPLLAKTIAWAPTRAEAVERLAAALEATTVEGVTTNLPLLRRVIAHPAFRAGDLHTGLLETIRSETTGAATNG